MSHWKLRKVWPAMVRYGWATRSGLVNSIVPETRKTTVRLPTLTASRSELYFVTSVPEPAGWVTRESWSATGDVRELRKAYEGFHPDVTRARNRALIDQP